MSSICVRGCGNGRRRTTHVFNQVHRPPADLRAQVLEHHFVSATHTCSRENGVVIQWFSIALEREFLSFDVELCRSGGFRCVDESNLRRLACTLGNFVANATFTSATFATSTGLSMVIASGKPRKRVDLPVEETVKVVIARRNRWGYQLFIYLSRPNAT